MLWFRAVRRRSQPTRLGFDDLEARRLLSGSTASPVNPSFDSLIGAAEVRQQNHVDGTGLAAAVIDTGADYNNPALGGGFGSGFKAEAGYDFAQNDPYPMADTWSHGTMVSGLIASNAPNASGVAPGADLVPLRVIGNNNQGSYNYVAQALQWVVTNHAAYNISVVNISLSDGGNYTSDPFVNSSIDNQIRSAITQLNALNIPVVCASGNSFDGTHQGMGYTAILSDTISVTGTDQQNHFVSDAQRLGSAAGGASATDLAAPGSGLLTTADNNTFTTVQGTSFAAPLVSGAVILLQQIYESRFGSLPSVSDVVSWLKQGSDPITDPSTGITIGKLDIPRAAALIPQPAKTVDPPSTPVSTPAPDSPGSTSTTTTDTSSGNNSGAGSTTTTTTTTDTSSSNPSSGGTTTSTSTADTTTSTDGSVAGSTTNVTGTSGNSSGTTSTSDASSTTSGSQRKSSQSSTGVSMTGESPVSTADPGTSASISPPPVDPLPSPASEANPAAARTTVGAVAPAPVVGPRQSSLPALSVSAPGLSVSDQIGLAPSRLLATLELRHQIRNHELSLGPHAAVHSSDRLIIMKAWRERRQLFRLARSVSLR